MSDERENITRDLERYARECRSLGTLLDGIRQRVGALAPPALTPDDVLTVSEIADLFGVKPHTVSTWRERGRLPEPWAQKPSGPLWLRSQIETVRLERGLPAWPEQDDQR